MRACGAWEHRKLHVGREQEGEEGRKEKEKRKRRKGKGGKGKEEKGEKEKEAPAGFAALVASRAWRRREATCTRNEENRESLNDN